MLTSNIFWSCWFYTRWQLPLVFWYHINNSPKQECPAIFEWDNWLICLQVQNLVIHLMFSPSFYHPVHLYPMKFTIVTVKRISSGQPSVPPGTHPTLHPFRDSSYSSNPSGFHPFSTFRLSDARLSDSWLVKSMRNPHLIRQQLKHMPPMRPR